MPRESGAIQLSQYFASGFVYNFTSQHQGFRASSSAVLQLRKSKTQTKQVDINIILPVKGYAHEEMQ